MTGLELIAKERYRQIKEKTWILNSSSQVSSNPTENLREHILTCVHAYHDRKYNLILAGAMIAAKLDQLIKAE